MHHADAGRRGAKQRGRRVSVADACIEYVRALRAEGRIEAAHDAHLRFRRVVYGSAADLEFTPHPRLGGPPTTLPGGQGGISKPRRPVAKTYRRRIPAHPLARTPLARLTTPQLRDWLVALATGGLSSPSANRTLAALKAALNLAVRNRRVDAASAREWADVRLLRHPPRRRDLFLDRSQRRALLRHAALALRPLLEAALYTGCRAGELTSARCAAFDRRTQTLTVTGKTGTRTIPLAPAAVTLFARLSRERRVDEHLLLRPNGRPWAHSDWDELVREAAARAGLPRATCLYTLRHSFITQLLLDGMSTLEVSKLSGTSLGMIDKHYGHLVFGAARARLAAVRFV